MYLERKIDTFLQEWKNDADKNPLIIRGPRQVGKTASIRVFAEKNYNKVIEINFYEEPIYKSIFEQGFHPEDIINNISRIDPRKQFEEGNTLLFFDEIQECPDVATSLKFFKEYGKYDAICSGSLLGLHYNKITSVSVGYKQDYEMRSMDFEEYLWAKGYPKTIRQDLLDHMLELKPFSDLEMRIYMNHFVDYCSIGGMPAVVSSYIETNAFSKPTTILQQLLEDYEEDARKYALGLDQSKIISVLRSIPAQLAKENKKFQYSKLQSGARAKDYFGCIDWLKDTGIINVCYCMHFPELPLKGNYDESKFKLYYSDTGLLVSSLDEESQQDLRMNQSLGVYKGAIYENMIAEAFKKQGYELFYYKRDDSTLEQDFFVRDKDNLIPVEVKARNSKTKSLKELIENDKYKDIQYGMKLTKMNIGYMDKVYTFPYFCAFLLKEYLSNESRKIEK